MADPGQLVGGTKHDAAPFPKLERIKMKELGSLEGHTPVVVPRFATSSTVSSTLFEQKIREDFLSN